MSAIESNVRDPRVLDTAEAPETGEPSKKPSKCCSCSSSSSDVLLKALLATNVAATALTTVSAAMASVGGSGMTAVFVAIGAGGASFAAQLGQIVALKKLGLKCCPCASSRCGAFLKSLLVTNVGVTAISTAAAAVAAGGGSGLTAVYVAFGTGGASFAVQIAEILVLRNLGLI